MSKLKIAVVGYGRMGVIIKKLALNAGHSVITFDPHNSDADFSILNAENLSGIDVAIEFSHPDSALANFDILIGNKIPTVAGVTGWYDSVKEVKSKVEAADTAFVYAGNFSLGVQLFFKIIENSSKLFNSFKEYDVSGYEIHHNQKADCPSGTAETIIEKILKNIEGKTKLLNESPNRKILPEELSFPSLRVGSMPGTHSVMFDSAVDTIELKHTARSREGFASGSILAAEWLVEKKGFFNVDDLIDGIISD